MALLDFIGQSGRLQEDEELRQLMMSMKFPQDQRSVRYQQMQGQPQPDPLPVPKSAPQPVEEKQGTGIFQKIGGGIKEYLSDPANRARLAAGFNTMRLNPDPNIAAMAQSTIQRQQEKAAQNKTVDYLRQINRPDLAQIAMAQPELALDILKKAYGVGSVSEKSYAPQLDPTTGQYYVTSFDPSTGEAKRINVPGAVGETPEAISKRELQQTVLVSDIQKAQSIGQELFIKAGNIDGMLYRLSEAYSALERGGKSGIFQQYLPSFDAATSTLRAAANTLGIDIINSATFGALSEKELALALSTGLPMELGEPELKKYIEEKITAQSKLRDELVKEARTLAGGNVPFSDYIKKWEGKGGTEVLIKSRSQGKPSNITDEQWNAMSDEDKRLFQ